VNKSLLKVVSGFDLVVVRDKSRKLVLSVYSQVMQRHFPGGTLEKYHKAIEDCAWLNPLPKPDHRYALEEDENLENIRTLILSTLMIRILRRMVSSTMVPLPSRTRADTTLATSNLQERLSDAARRVGPVTVRSICERPMQDCNYTLR
jgi:hypothetical protein